MSIEAGTPPAPLPLVPADSEEIVELESWCWFVVFWLLCGDCCCCVVVDVVVWDWAEVANNESATGVTDTEDEEPADEVNIDELGFSERALAEDEVDGATQQLENGLKAVGPIAEDQVLVSCRHTECHIEVR